MTRARFPSSLGDLVAEYIEKWCVHGPGDIYGQSVRITGEEHRLLDECYRIDPKTGRRVHDEVGYSRIKGTRKSELGGWLNIAESYGPVRAFLDENGTPCVGPPMYPVILNAATTEDQADLVYGAFTEMVRASDELEELFDTGVEFTRLKAGAGGEIKLVQTRNTKALEGGRPTFQVADEGHHWLPSLHRSYGALQRNLRKRTAAQPWIFVPTNAYGPGQESITEIQHHAWLEIEQGKRSKGRFFFDHRQAATVPDRDDRDGVIAAVVEARGDAYWLDPVDIAGFLDLPTTVWAEFVRFFLGIPLAAPNQPFTPVIWDELADPSRRLKAGEEIAVGFDGSRYSDSTALVACRVSDGFLQPLAVWEKPVGPGADGWEVPENAVDRVVDATFTRFRVRRLYADPPFWRTAVDRWHGKYGDAVRKFHTNRPSVIGPAIDRLSEAYRSRQLVHDGSEVMSRHFAHVRQSVDRGWARWDKPVGEQLQVLGDEPRIDVAMAACIAYEARADALAAGEDEGDKPVPVLIRY